MSDKKIYSITELDLDISNIVYNTAKEINLIDINKIDIKLKTDIDVDKFCHDIYKGIQEACEYDLEKQLSSNFYKMVGYYCFVAGIGTACISCNKCDETKNANVVEVLSRKGIMNMDTLVRDVCNPTCSINEEFKDKVNSLFNLSMFKALEVFKREYPCNKDEEFFPYCFIEVCKALFMSGYAKEYLSINQSIRDADLLKAYEVITKFHYSPHNVYGLNVCALTLNKKIKELDSIYLPKGYVFDEYIYSDVFNTKNTISYSKHIYVRKENAEGEYCPKIKRNWLQKLMNCTPKNLIFTCTEYKEDMRITARLHTEQCIRTIPRPESYLRVKDNKYGLWQYFLFVSFMYGELYPIIFTFDIFKKEYPDLFCKASNAIYYVDNMTVMEETNFFPSLTKTGDIVNIEYYYYNDGKIKRRKRKYKIESNKILFINSSEIVIYTMQKKSNK